MRNNPVIKLLRDIGKTIKNKMLFYSKLQNSSRCVLLENCRAEEFDWNGDVATRVDMRTTKVKFFQKYLCEGMSDLGKIIHPGK